MPSPPELTALLRNHLDEHGTTQNGQLFRGARGRPLSESLYGRLWGLAPAAALSTGDAASPLARRPYDPRHAAVSTRSVGCRRTVSFREYGRQPRIRVARRVELHRGGSTIRRRNPVERRGSCQRTTADLTAAAPDARPRPSGGHAPRARSPLKRSRVARPDDAQPTSRTAPAWAARRAHRARSPPRRHPGTAAAAVTRSVSGQAFQSGSGTGVTGCRRTVTPVPDRCSA